MSKCFREALSIYLLLRDAYHSIYSWENVLTLSDSVFLIILFCKTFTQSHQIV